MDIGIGSWMVQNLSALIIVMNILSLCTGLLNMQNKGMCLLAVVNFTCFVITGFYVLFFHQPVDK